MLGTEIQLVFTADDAGRLLDEFRGAQAVPAGDPHPRRKVMLEGRGRNKKEEGFVFCTQSLI